MTDLITQDIATLPALTAVVGLVEPWRVEWTTLHHREFVAARETPWPHVTMRARIARCRHGRCWVFTLYYVGPRAFVQALDSQAFATTDDLRALLASSDPADHPYRGPGT